MTTIDEIHNFDAFHRVVFCCFIFFTVNECVYLFCENKKKIVQNRTQYTRLIFVRCFSTSSSRLFSFSCALSRSYCSILVAVAIVVIVDVVVTAIAVAATLLLFCLQLNLSRYFFIHTFLSFSFMYTF